MTDYEFVKSIILLSPGRIGHVSKSLKAFLIPDDESKHVWSLSDSDFQELLALHVEEIKTRPDPSKRVEDWECFDIAGYKSELMRERLLAVRRSVPPRKTKYVDMRSKQDIVDQVPGAAIGDFDLIVSEVQLNPDYSELKDKAELLGLIK